MPENEIDQEALASVSHVAQEQVEDTRQVPVWLEDGAPEGSTEGSLMVYNNAGKPVRVCGPTHYHHLADGRVLAHYNGGTHYAEPGDNGHDKVTRILQIVEG